MSAFLKNLPVKILGGRCLSVWGPRSPPPPVTHCMNTCTPVFVLIHTGKGGEGGRWTSEKVRGVLNYPPPPPLLLTVWIHVPLYLYLFTQGRGGGVGRWTSEKVRGAPDSPSPPLLHTVWMHVPRYMYLFTQGRGGGKGRWTSEKVRGALVHKRAVIPTWMTVSPVYINSIKHQ